MSVAVEQQALARVHRFGQTRPVRIVRLICDATVEARPDNCRLCRAHYETDRAIVSRLHWPGLPSSSDVVWGPVSVLETQERHLLLQDPKSTEKELQL